MERGSMAKSTDLPGFTQKRKTLFSPKTSAESLRVLGKEFMEAERYDDALEFFQRAGAEDMARHVAEKAMQAGDTALYMRAKKVLGDTVSDEEWTRIARAAEQARRYSAAYLAHSQAGHEEEAARLQQLVPGLSTPEQEDDEPVGTD